jgi:hypothetical protein
MRFLLCGGRLKVEVVELGDRVCEVFVFVGNGTYSVVDILKTEGFVCIECENNKEKVMSKVVNDDVIEYITQVSVTISKEMKKWRDEEVLFYI